MSDPKTMAFPDLSRNVKQTDTSNHIRLMWPDDYISLGPDDPFVTVEEDSNGGEFRLGKGDEGQMKRMLVRPQVTVNVFSTGGSSLGGSGGSGSGTGGSGEGGSATINDGLRGYGGTCGNCGNSGNSGNSGNGPDAIHALASQLAALSEKVEQLSLLSSVRGAIIESGTWSTDMVRPWNQPRHKTQGRVTFEKEFKKVPRVTTSINKLDISNQSNTRVKAFVTDVDTRGFTVHAESWYDTQLYTCEVTWLAMGE